MEPSVMDMNEQDNILKFTLSNSNVSFANALRRTILSDIPTIVIRTFPYEKNDANFEINTTRFNNEILKQRLSCIPIYIKDLAINLEDYLLEIDVKNTYDQMIYVTTADFKIKNLKTDKYLSDSNLSEIFPPNPISNQFIDFCRLKPAYSEDHQGEHIKLTAKFTIGTAKENGSFNVVSTCAYGNTPDLYAIDQAKQTKLEELQTKYTSDEDIKYHLTDWLNLDAKRIYVPDRFDFKIKTLGVFTNTEIVVKAVKIIIEKLFKLKEIYSTSNNLINPSENTIENSFDITLNNEDFTIGKVIEYSLYQLYYIGNKTLTFCGFSKPHPHLDKSIIRIAFSTEVDKTTIVSYLTNSIDFAIVYFNKLLPHFGELSQDEAFAIKASIPPATLPPPSIEPSVQPSIEPSIEPSVQPPSKSSKKPMTISKPKTKTSTSKVDK
jgi:DNA-directed RNA polymerase subunit L